MWQLRVGTYDFRFRALESIRLPLMQANMWRGVLGRQLRLMSDGHLPPPADLPDWIQPRELFAYFMTTPPPPDAPAMRRYPQVPHPFALSARWTGRERTLEAGEELGVRLRLFGRANDLIDVAMLAMARAAYEGLGKGRGRARLEEVSMSSPDGLSRIVIFRPGEAFVRQSAEVPAIPRFNAGRLRLQFLSPLRIQHQGRIMKPAGFAIQPLVMNILRRLSMLQLFHEGKELDLNFRALKEQAALVKILDAELHWADVHRYSARQKREVPAGGIMGRVVVDAGNAGDVMPFLWLGQYIQAGKGTTLGLGEYRVDVESK